MNTNSCEPFHYVEIRFNRKRLVLKWYSGDVDHVAQKFGRVIDYSGASGNVCIKLSADASLKSILSDKPDFKLTLNMINMLEDIGFRKNRVPKTLYDKVFFGCNLPALRKGGEFYRPVLSLAERSRLRRFIIKGCEFIFNNTITEKE
jgi:hypothetical protein